MTRLSDAVACLYSQTQSHDSAARCSHMFVQSDAARCLASQMQSHDCTVRCSQVFVQFEAVTCLPSQMHLRHEKEVSSFAKKACMSTV